MKNTQTFNTNQGIDNIKAMFKVFKSSKQNKDRRRMAVAYNHMASSCNLFPPCSVVSSLKDDIQNYQIKNIIPDLKVIEASRDKIKY